MTSLRGLMIHTRTLLLLLLLSPVSARQQVSTLEVETVEQGTGIPVPARIYLTDGEGNPVTPPGLIAYAKRMENHFVSPGSFRLDLEGGRYRLAAERGTEYRPASIVLDLVAGRTEKVTLRLERWIRMNGQGWYSGDLHNHRKPEEMTQLLLAEDLNLAPTLADWIWEDRPVSHPPAGEAPLRVVDALHVYSVLDKEIERLERGPGAVNLLGLRSVIPFDGYRLYPPSERYCRQAHAQGGYVDAEKIVWRDVAALVALGQIDFAGIVHNHFNRHDVELETDRWGMIPKHGEFNTAAGMPLWSMEVYYRFLNCGFRLPVSAGSASGVKAAPLGYNRVYVRLEEPFGYESWFRSLKAGRSFATNGPMLFLTVDGHGPGAVLTHSGNSTAKRRIRVDASSAGEIDRLEVVANGEIVRRLDRATSGGHWSVEFDAELEEPGWVVARCFEIPSGTIRFAHTSPVYLGSGKNSRAGADARFFMEWIDREMEFYKKEEGFRKPDDREAMLSFFQRARDVYEALLR